MRPRSWRALATAGLLSASALSTAAASPTRPTATPVETAADTSAPIGTYDVWITDQGNTAGYSAAALGGTHGGRLLVFNSMDLDAPGDPINAPMTIDLAVTFRKATAANTTGADVALPSSIEASPDGRYVAVGFAGSGHVAVLDANTHKAKALFQMGTANGGTPSVSTASWTSDGSAIVVANTGSRLLERIDYDKATDTFTRSAGATLDLVACTTPSGMACQTVVTGIPMGGPSITPTTMTPTTMTPTTMPADDPATTDSTQTSDPATLPTIGRPATTIGRPATTAGGGFRTTTTAIEAAGTETTRKAVTTTTRKAATTTRKGATTAAPVPTTPDTAAPDTTDTMDTIDVPASAAPTRAAVSGGFRTTTTAAQTTTTTARVAAARAVTSTASSTGATAANVSRLRSTASTTANTVLALADAGDGTPVDGGMTAAMPAVFAGFSASGYAGALSPATALSALPTLSTAKTTTTKATLKLNATSTTRKVTTTTTRKATTTTTTAAKKAATTTTTRKAANAATATTGKAVGATATTAAPAGPAPSDPLANLRPDTAPLCAIPTAGGDVVVTLRGGGLFVVDPAASPMQLVAAYDNETIGGGGCGRTFTGDLVFLHAMAGTGAATAGDTLFTMPLTGLPRAPQMLDDNSATALPTSYYQAGASAMRPTGMVLAGPKPVLWQFDGIGNMAALFDAITLTSVGAVPLVNAATTDAAPDGAQLSPDGTRIFVALRGTHPVGLADGSDGASPGLGVIDLTATARDGVLSAVLPTSYPSPIDHGEQSDPVAVALVVHP